MSYQQKISDILTAALKEANAEPEQCNRASLTLTSVPVVLAATQVERSESVSFCYVLGGIIGQLLDQVSDEAQRAFDIGAESGQRVIRIFNEESGRNQVTAEGSSEIN